MGVINFLSKVFGANAEGSTESKSEPVYNRADVLNLSTPYDEWGIQLDAGRYTVLEVKDNRYTLQDEAGQKHNLSAAFTESRFDIVGSSWDAVKDFREPRAFTPK